MSEQVLPFYLVCDESGSMAGGIDDMNDGLAKLHAEIANNPVVADKTRFAVIGFSDDAEVLLPLSDLADVEEIPGLTAKGLTSFGAAFRKLKQEIQKDVSQLKADGHSVLRPVVFFLSDGQATDRGWESAHADLVNESFSAYPKIVAFGLEKVDPDTIRRVATFKAFTADEGISPATALREFASSLTKSIVRSGSTLQGSGAPTLQVEDTVPGFTALPLDQI